MHLDESRQGATQEDQNNGMQIWMHLNERRQGVAPQEDQTGHEHLDASK